METMAEAVKNPYAIRHMVARFSASARFYSETCDRLGIPEDERDDFMVFCGSAWPSEGLAKKWGER